MQWLNFLLPTKKNSYSPIILRAESLSLIFLALFSLQLSQNLTNYSKAVPPQGNVLGFAVSIHQSELIKLTNQERVQRGLSALTESASLDQAAQLKAQNIFQENYWAHVSPSGISPWHWFEQTGYRYLMAGENLAKDFNTSAGAIAGWMASTTHRENLLNPDFTEIGLAVVNGNLSGQDTTLVVQLFGRPAVNLAQAAVSAAAPTPLPASAQPSHSLSTASSAAAFGTTAFSQPNQPELTSAGRLSQLANFFNPRAFVFSQLITIMAMAVLVLLFVIDSLVLWRIGVLRKNSHSFLHAGILSLLLAALIWQSKGTVL